MTQQSRTLKAIAEAKRLQAEMDREDREEVRQAAAERRQSQAPVPIKKHQRKIQRLPSSPRQARVSSQTQFFIKAMFEPESAWNETPIIDDTTGLTRDVGPNDLKANGPFNPAKETHSKTGDTTKKPRTTRGPMQPGGKRVNYQAIANQLKDLL